ncbi:MAG: MCE family protein [Candidatus Cloacimonetes bacterium]|nr:MCE family protein [Candidatus Cloacimonadota bacterium]
MKFKFRHTDKIVGIFFFGALIILLGGIVLVALSQKMLVKKYSFQTRFQDAGGISQTTNLYFKGFEIGRIKKFRLNQDNLIDVELVVYEDYREKIIAQSAINKSSNPITGRGSLEFLQGPPGGELLPEDSYIPSLDMPEGKQLLLENKIVRSGDVISSILKNIDDILSNLKKDNNPDQGAIFRILFNLANATETLNSDLLTLQDLMVNLDNRVEQTTVRLDDALSETTTLIRNYQDPAGLAVNLIDPGKTELIQPLHNVLLKLDDNLAELHGLLLFLNQESPEISGVLYESRSSLQTVQKTLQGINNHPLIRRGISRDSRDINRNIKIRPEDF